MNDNLKNNINISHIYFIIFELNFFEFFLWVIKLAYTWILYQWKMYLQDFNSFFIQMSVACFIIYRFKRQTLYIHLTR